MVKFLVTYTLRAWRFRGMCRRGVEMCKRGVGGLKIQQLARLKF